MGQLPPDWLVRFPLLEEGNHAVCASIRIGNAGSLLRKQMRGKNKLGEKGERHHAEMVAACYVRSDG